jgi:SM-20-related protein
MIDLAKIKQAQLATAPYAWTMIDELYARRDARRLAATYPRDHFKTMIGRDDEKEWRYEVRSLIGMSARAASYAEQLSPQWQALANDLLSDEYRVAVSAATGLDLMNAPLEVNAFHYGAGAWQGPHKDLPTKRVTHVMYFNRHWRAVDGGQLRILRSQEMSDIYTTVLPEVGNSALFVRSENSWHAVEPVVEGCTLTRRSIVATFYHPDSPSTMWPTGEMVELHDYPPQPSTWAKWRNWFR